MDSFLKKHFDYIIFGLFLLFLIIAIIEKYATAIKYDENKSIEENINLQTDKSLKIVILVFITILLDGLLLLYIINYSHQSNKAKNILLYFNVFLIFVLNFISLILSIKIKDGNYIDIYNQNKKYLDVIEILNLVSGFGPRLLLFFYLIGFKIMNRVSKKTKHILMPDSNSPQSVE
jgi:hypothetical protein